MTKPLGMSLLALAALLTVAGYVALDATAQAQTRPADAGGAVKPKEVVLDLGNGVSLKLLPIPAGEFDMGSPANEEGRFDNETLHRVKLTRGFYMGVSEVTQGQWQAVMGNNPSGFKGDANLPVERVSWDDAVAFCAKLTERERAAGRIGATQRYRLPTEAEWEYACRAGTAGPYAGTGKLAEMGWILDNSGIKTHPVGQKKPNAWGLYDTHGNVWEWCADWYGEYPDGAVEDPTGPENGQHRVLRGGSWRYDPRLCRSANRYWFGPDGRLNYVGFRVCLDFH